MALTLSINLTAEDKEVLLTTARLSIRHGLETGKILKIDPQEYSLSLQQLCATFVTLNINHQLRGCIGTLQAYQPLISDVAEHAFAAAFQDPRFPVLNKHEESQLDIHISILTAAETIEFKSEEDLLQQIQVGIDGLILQEGSNRGTFLPSVWEQIPDTKSFLQHLKMKAGLPENYWSNNIKVSRYHTLSIP